jgi:hypothetical protein
VAASRSAQSGRHSTHERRLIDFFLQFGLYVAQTNSQQTTQTRSVTSMGEVASRYQSAKTEDPSSADELNGEARMRR